MTKRQAAISAIDSLLGKNLGVDDLLLDTRLMLTGGGEPGRCVENYFRLRRRLSDWHRADLDALREGLEEGIALQIIAADERRRRCLGLAGANQLEDYCREQMQRSAKEFRSAEQITLRFCWA